MSTHFNAFISYRHSPLDSEVAQRIHRQLERFRIPKAIQKATGMKKIDRIFRDKEELPLSVNLSDDINEALVNSDFLVVICSPRFQQSQWCMREIELFLQTHPVEHVLIVLAEGEPDDVVPPILMQDREPLCCDFRMKPRKAKNIELPRLVSAILGCRYDELRQRQRQYRMRRTIAFFSAALVATVSLMIYFIHTSIQIQKANDDLYAANVQISEANVQIQNNLDQALRNQSEYLASSAQKLMEGGDRLTAIALALEALPDENNDRPYVATAERALSDALGSYEAEKKVVAQGAYFADNLVSDFKLTEDGKQIYILDARDVLTVWDVNAFQKLHTIDLSNYGISDFHITREGNILFTVSSLENTLVCVDLAGNELWKQENSMDIAFMDQDSVLLVLYGDFADTKQILFLDPDTGKQVREPLPVACKEDGSGPLSFLQEEYQTGHPLTLRYLVGFSSYEVALMDMQTGTTRMVLSVDSSFESGQTIDVVGTTQDGNVVVVCGDGSGMSNGKILNMETTSRARSEILCFDGKTGELLWKSEIITYVYSANRVAEPIPDSNWMLLQCGNTFLVCDSRTGEQIAQCQSVSQPMTVSVEADKAIGVMENGSYFSFRYGENECASLTMVDGTVGMAKLHGGLFIHKPLEMQVIAYWLDEEDEQEPLACDVELVPRFTQLSGSDLVIENYASLVMLDGPELTQRWWLETGYGYEALGFSADGREFWVWNEYENFPAAFSVEDGTRRDLEVPTQRGEQYCLLESNVYKVGDQLLYMLKSKDGTWLLRVDLGSGEILQEYTADILTEPELTYSATARILLVADRYAWIYREEGALVVVDLESGSAKQLAEGLSAVPAVTYSEDLGQILLGIEHELHLTTPGGALICKIGLDDRKAVSSYFYNNQLLTLCDDANLYRYDRMGRLLSQTSMNIFNTFAYDASKLAENPTQLGWWETEDGNLIINIFGAGNIVDCSSWQSRAYVPNLVTYVPESDTLLCVSKQKLYAIARYTTQQLMELAREELGDFRLSEEVRSFYGLNKEEE